MKMLKQLQEDGHWSERRSARIEAATKGKVPSPASPENSWHSHISKTEVEALCEDHQESHLATAEDVENEAAPEDHKLNQRKRRQFVQLVCESLGCPPEFHHDGSICWGGPVGTIAQIGHFLPIEVDFRTMRTVMTRTWEAWATGDLDGFDAGVMESCEEGSTRRRGRKRALADDEIQLALRYARADGLDVALGMVNDLRKAKREGHDGTPPDPTKMPAWCVLLCTAPSSHGGQNATIGKPGRQAAGIYIRFGLSSVAQAFLFAVLCCIIIHMYVWFPCRYAFAKQLQEQFSDIPDSERTPGWTRLDRYHTPSLFLPSLSSSPLPFFIPPPFLYPSLPCSPPAQETPPPLHGRALWRGCFRLPTQSEDRAQGRWEEESQLS